MTPARGRRADLEPARAARAARAGATDEQLVAALGVLGLAQLEALTRCLPPGFAQAMHARAIRGPAGRDEERRAELDAALALVLERIDRDQAGRAA